MLLPLLALTAGMMLLLYRGQASATRAIIESTEQKIVDVAHQRILARLSLILSDAVYLSEQATLQQWLATDDPELRRRQVEDYLTFANSKRIYDQIRFLDLTGQEVLRVDWNAGSPQIVPDDKLQNKSDRYYFTQAATLDRGQIYVSELDLNVERGVVEQPEKPMIRLAVPVFDAVGRKRGVVVLNYLARQMLSRLRSIGDDDLSEFWLMTADGYWLIGSRPDDEWGFMYPDRRERSFANGFPDVWQQMQSQSSGSRIEADGDVFTFARVSLTADLPTMAVAGDPDVAISAGPTWFIVTRLSAEALAGQTAASIRDLGLASVFLVVVLGGTSLGLARYQIHRQQGAQQIRLSEARFRSVTETASDAIVSADSRGRIIYFNPAAERIFGYTAQEAQDQPLTILMPERFKADHTKGLERFLATRQGKIVGATVELVARRKDGHEFPVDLALASGEAGNAVFFTAIIRDITIRAEAERQLRASEARFRDLLQSAPDSVLITDDAGRIQLVNAQAEALFGYRKDELIGQNIEILVPARYRKRHVDHRNGYVGAARTRPMGAGLALYGVRKDGTEFPVSVSLSPTRTDRGLTVFCDVRDITDQRRAEVEIQDLNRRLKRDNAELATVNKELESFSYSVSHDLRAPLRAIDGFSQALLEDAGPLLDPEHRSHLDRVRAAAQRMGLLIDDLLKLARVTRADLSIGDVDLSAIAQEIANDLRDEAPDRRVEFAITPDLHAVADARLVQVALENLISNSWKFTAPCSPARIAFGKAPVNGKAAFFVRDNGVGFDMAHAGKLFGVFQRLHDVREFPGTGIGLATVQRVIHKHGGRIWAESVPDGGATFFFTL